MSKETLLILGASSDIGGALIRALPKGYGKVIAHANRSGERLRLLAVERPDLAIEIVKADLADRGQTQALLDELSKRGPAPTGLVHLPAPPFAYRRLRELSWEQVQRELDVQCRSLFLLFKTFLPLMAEQGGGRVVVLLSSVTVEPPPRFLTHYVVAKEALLGLVRSAAAEFCDKHLAINAVSPAMVDTRFIADLPMAVREEMAQQTSLKRFLRPEEVAASIQSLLADASPMTGMNVLIPPANPVV